MSAPVFSPSFAHPSTSHFLFLKTPLKKFFGCHKMKIRWTMELRKFNKKKISPTSPIISLGPSHEKEGKICVTFTSGVAAKQQNEREVSCGEQWQRKMSRKKFFPFFLYPRRNFATSMLLIMCRIVRRELAALRGICANIIMQIYDQCIDTIKDISSFQ